MELKSLKSNKGKNIEGLYLIQPNLIEDNRGFFMESWNQDRFDLLLGLEVKFVQDNHSQSDKNVLRGLHFQNSPFEQGKLIRCVKGKIYDVAVDIRKESKSFGEWTSIILDDTFHNQLWIPKGFAHGFLTLSHTATVLYKATNYYNKDSERTILWKDKFLSISWPLIDREPIISNKDKKGLEFNKLKMYFS
mgnify:CR=1 FL=1